MFGAPLPVVVVFMLKVGYVTHVDGDGDGGGGGGSSSAGGAASSTSTSTAKSVLERTFGVRYSPGDEEEEEEGGGWLPRVCEECTKAAAERAELAKIVFEVCNRAAQLQCLGWCVLPAWI